MPIEKQDYVERVLVVLNPDGTLKGAAQYRIHRVVEDGVDIVSPQQGNAEELAIDALASVLSPGDAALAGQLSAALARIDALSAQLEEAQLRRRVETDQVP